MAWNQEVIGWWWCWLWWWCVGDCNDFPYWQPLFPLFPWLIACNQEVIGGWWWCGKCIGHEFLLTDGTRMDGQHKWFLLIFIIGLSVTSYSPCTFIFTNQTCPTFQICCGPADEQGFPIYVARWPSRNCALITLEKIELFTKENVAKLTLIKTAAFLYFFGWLLVSARWWKRPDGPR